MDAYLTIGVPGEGLYKEKGSKFLAFASRVNDEQEVKRKLEELRKRFYDARHHCYAYILGSQSDRYRANDDGEPNHSAGDPILGQIRSKGLTDTLVVVVRYFGGTKLGVSGLINAYRTAANEALAQAQIIEVPIRDAIRVKFGYEATSEVMRLLKEYEVEIGEQQFLEKCLIDGYLKKGLGETLKSQLALAGIEEVQVIPAS